VSSRQRNSYGLGFSLPPSRLMNLMAGGLEGLPHLGDRFRALPLCRPGASVSVGNRRGKLILVSWLWRRHRRLSHTSQHLVAESIEIDLAGSG
jgi:hypothetical protein